MDNLHVQLHGSGQLARGAARLRIICTWCCAAQDYLHVQLCGPKELAPV